MEIASINLNNYRNAEHFKFQTEFKELIEDRTAEALGISALFAEYLPIYAKEVASLFIVVKSEKTQLLADADMKRELTAHGLRDTVKAALKHYDADVRKAGAKIQVVLKSYGDLASRNYIAESAAIYKLVDVLNENYTEEVATVGISQWLVVLKTQNDAFELIKNERFAEATMKTKLRMKSVRAELDKRYRAIVKHINARIEVFGESDYADFVRQVNIRIANYENVLARRKGRNDKTDEDEGDAG